MGFQPMDHRQDADATRPTGKMPVILMGEPPMLRRAYRRSFTS